ncbi:hypothetical protein HZH66_014533 [Vespula vulgaris]|uniref:Uncharacterized protein n=1 Tax=Vespula vulgaris TaxID=7454 RepID=A0A834MRE1_VESVU|nr:hypothetical protein HZH66_014533 [Vespula vulgaris]
MSSQRRWDIAKRVHVKFIVKGGEGQSFLIISPISTNRSQPASLEFDDLCRVAEFAESVLWKLMDAVEDLVRCIAHNGGGEKWRYSNGGESNGGYQRGSTRFLTGDRSRAEALRERNNGLPKITWAPLLAVRNETCWKP